MAQQPQRDSPKPTPPARLEGLAPSGRTRRGGEATQVLEFDLQTVTPVYGGGARLPHAALDTGPDGRPVARPERLNAHVAVRGASVAAEIRAWWRILEAAACVTAAELRNRESELWGSVHAGTPRRSQVDVWVMPIGGAERDTSPVDDAYGYALWPARPVSEAKRDDAKGDKAKNDQTPWAPRWKRGLSFALHLRMPLSKVAEVERAVRAWVLFGGYGARTRRGCGALTAPGAAWLPAEATREAIEAALGLAAGALATGAAEARDTPALAGGRFACGTTTAKPEDAWKVALGWLRDFRQERGDSEWHARGQGSGNKPGRSRWPEPDKIRQLGLHSDEHEPRYGAKPAWPRAGLGLPIVFSAWQRKPDPPLTLIWRTAERDFERLASPLIVKPLPLANKGFAPLALWLHRADPKGGQVVLSKGKQKGEHVIDDGSAAPFDRLLGAKDEPLFKPLRGAATLREAFFAWLRERRKSDAEVWP
jgi:CRISPR-associated protein Cmr1